jgi:hypothetical protein
MTGPVSALATICQDARCVKKIAAVNNSLGSAHRRALARHPEAIRQLELGFRALHPREQTWGVGCRIRDAGEPWTSRRRGTYAVEPFAACLGSAGRARRGRGEVDRKCPIPRPSDRPDSMLPP